jgi:hypothetical protein
MIKGKKGISHAWDPLREGFYFVLRRKPRNAVLRAPKSIWELRIELFKKTN